MERDRETNSLIFDPCEQREAGVEREVSVDMAPSLANDLIDRLQETLESRQELDACDVYDIHPAERQTKKASLEIRLASISRMQKQLYELAGEEIIQASLEGAEEFSGIDLGTLYFR